MKNEVKELLQAISGDLKDVAASFHIAGDRISVLSEILEEVPVDPEEQAEPPDPDPEEPVEPEEPEEPPVASPGEVVLSELFTEPQNLADMILFFDQHAGSRYERFSRHVVLDGAYNLRVRRYNISTGGGLLSFATGRYHLVVNGADYSHIDVAGNPTDIYFPGNTSDLSPGWVRLQVRAPNGKLSASFFVHVGTERVGDAIPVWTNVYDMINRTNSVHMYQWVHADAKPKVIPLTPKVFEPFGHEVNRNNLVLRQIAINHPTNQIYWADGIPTTAGKQPYFYSDLIKGLPALPAIDGPRGTAMLHMPTHITVGIATVQEGPNGEPVNPNSPRKEPLYVTTAWSLVHVGEDGEATTLLGYRHKRPPYWEKSDSNELELVGDWSAIPEERRKGFEFWGFCFMAKSLTIDINADPVPGEGRRPHLHNPIGIIADSPLNRLLRVEFDGRDRSVPPKVTEIALWLNEPWDVVPAPNPDHVIVSDRFAHRIVEVHAETGELVRVLVQGVNMARVDGRFTPRYTGTLEQRRLHDTVMPEGLFNLDNEWLYFSSIAQAQVKRRNFQTGEIQVVCNFPIDSNTRYSKIAVSDGTFYDRGTVFISTWSNANYGVPYSYRPDGTKLPMSTFLRNHPTFGPGGGYEQMSYGATVGIGKGRLVFGTAKYGLWDLSLRTPADANIDVAKFKRGVDKLNPLLFSREGYSAFGVPLPDGDEDIDYVAQVGGYRQ